jgi:hypothetical protein
LQATCVANQCATAPVADCTPDGGTPAGVDLAAPVGDLAGLNLGGGGGCALGGGASPRAPALVVAALFLFALSLRRRSA